MDKIICYTAAIGLIIVALVPCFCKKVEELENIARVMDLIFLRAYEQRVKSHGKHIIDESEQIQFFSTWEPILGTEKTNAVFRRTQKHLKYALDIVYNADFEDISDLVITIHSRILALYQGVNCLKCIVFAQFYTLATFKLEHCLNIAIHLFIFSDLGLDKLMNKFQSFINSYAENYIALTYYMNKIMEDLPNIPTTVGLFIKSNLSEQEVMSAELRSTVYQENIILFHGKAMQAVGKCFSHIEYIGYLLMDLNSGSVKIGESFGAHRIYSSYRYQNDISFWTDTFFGKNEKLQQKSPSYLDRAKYDVTSLIRDNIIQKAAADGVNRRKMVELFDGVKPNHLIIYLKPRGVVSNVEII